MGVYSTRSAYCGDVEGLLSRMMGEEAASVRREVVILGNGASLRAESSAHMESGLFLCAAVCSHCGTRAAAAAAVCYKLRALFKLQGLQCIKACFLLCVQMHVSPFDRSAFRKWSCLEDQY